MQNWSVPKTCANLTNTSVFNRDGIQTLPLPAIIVNLSDTWAPQNLILHAKWPHSTARHCLRTHLYVIYCSEWRNVWFCEYCIWLQTTCFWKYWGAYNFICTYVTVHDICRNTIIFHHAFAFEFCSHLAMGRIWCASSTSASINKFIFRVESVWILVWVTEAHGKVRENWWKNVADICRGKWCTFNISCTFHINNIWEFHQVPSIWNKLSIKQE